MARGDRALKSQREFLGTFTGYFGFSSVCVFSKRIRSIPTPRLGGGGAASTVRGCSQHLVPPAPCSSFHWSGGDNTLGMRAGGSGGVGGGGGRMEDRKRAA